MSHFTDALLDAAAGHFEHLPAFGLEATRSGDLVRVSRPGAHQLVVNTPEALAAALSPTSFPELTYRDYCQR